MCAWPSGRRSCFRPNLKQLPQPGTGVAVATARPDWPTNPEVVQKQVAKDKAAQEAQQEADAEADPTNPYAGKPTLLDKAFGKLWGKGDADASPVDDVPEPDPSDKRPEDKGKTAVASSAGPKPPQVPDAVMPSPDRRSVPSGSARQLQGLCPAAEIRTTIDASAWRT